MQEYEDYYEKGVAGRAIYDDEYDQTYKKALPWWTNTNSVAKDWYWTGAGQDDQNRILFDVPAWYKGSTNFGALDLVSAFNSGRTDIKNLAPRSDAFNNANAGTIYYNINMDNKIDSDYSVDQMWDQMKEKIHEEAMYKNTVALDFSRR